MGDEQICDGRHSCGSPVHDRANPLERKPELRREAHRLPAHHQKGIFLDVLFGQSADHWRPEAGSSSEKIRGPWQDDCQIEIEPNRPIQPELSKVSGILNDQVKMPATHRFKV
jgi:hypothetical protein